MTDERAFPELVCESHSAMDGLSYVGFEGGLTKRELFAAMAMQGILSGVYSNIQMLNEFTREEGGPMAVRRHLTGCEAAVRASVNYADALIKELNKPKGVTDENRTSSVGK